MIFLIDYECKTGVLHQFKRFRDDQRAEAQRERLVVEMSWNGSRESHEVVLLEAEREETLRRTHRRYFETTKEIVESMLASDSSR